MPAPKKKIRRTIHPPEGFVYRPEFLSQDEERQLLAAIQQLPFEQALFQGYVAKRRIVAYGVDYSFDTRQVTPGEPFPDFMLRLRNRLGELLPDVAPDQFVEGLVTEYTPGTPIGWHRDAPQFGVVCGLSLLSPCRMRLRLATEEEYEITNVLLDRRSAYALTGEARWRWQHSIPEVKELRYSITFRTLREKSRISLEEDAA